MKKFYVLLLFMLGASFLISQELTPKQKNHVRNADMNLGTAERYLASPYTASSALRSVEKAEKDISALKEEIPDHPKVQELLVRLLKCNDALANVKAQDISKKIASLQRGYDYALQGKDAAKASKNLEEIKKLCLELEKYKETEIGQKEYQKSLDWIAEKEKPAEQPVPQKPLETVENTTKEAMPEITEEQKRTMRLIEGDVYSAQRHLENYYSASYALPYIEKAKKEMVSLLQAHPSHPEIQALQAKILKLENRLEECKLEEVLAMIQKNADWYEGGLQRNTSEAELERYKNDLKILIPKLEKFQNTERGKAEYQKWNKWLAEKNWETKPAETQAPVVKKDPKPPVIKKDPKQPVIKKDPKQPVIKKDPKPPVVKKDPVIVENKEKPKYTEKQAKDANARLYSNISFAKSYQEKCIQAKESLQERADYPNATEAQKALGQLWKCLENGQKFAEIVSCYPEEYKENLSKYNELQEFCKSYKESLREPIQKAWEAGVSQSFRYFREAMGSWQEGMKKYQEEVANSYDTIETANRIREQLAYNEKEAHRTLEELKKKSLDDAQNLDGYGLQFLKDIKIESHPDIQKASQEIKETAENCTKLCEEMSVFAIIKKAQNMIEEARKILERGNQNKDEYDMKTAMESYDKILEYLKEHGEKKGVTEWMEKVQQEKSSPEFQKALNHFSGKQDRIAKAKAIFQNFLKKKKIIEELKDAEMAELRKHLQEGRNMLKPAIPYLDIDEVKNEYTSYTGFIAYEERKLDEIEEERRIDAILKKADPKKSSLFQTVNAKFGNSLREWVITCDKGKGKIFTKFGNKWDVWAIELPQGKASVETRFGNSMREWKYKADNAMISISTESGNKWDSWIIKDSQGNTLSVYAKFGNTLKEWKIQGQNGMMEVYPRFNNTIQEWIIKDRMPEENPHLKMASILSCIFTATEIVLEKQ
ncbi:MAG: hypothetical protein HUU50_10700 [Candidatus Brocadiae bacterium]|nr:hypothetical protein [Candidatus Brocadiia bacterium]